jgi:hypothetical protein
MDRFVNHLRDVPAIPEEVYVRARWRAWARLQAGAAVVPPPRRLPWVLAALVPAAALAAWLSLPRIAEVPAPPPPVAFVPAAVPRVQAPPSAARAAVRKPVRTSRTAPRHERLVLNFVLPDSGVRMIWIMDSKFKLDGGTE